MSGTLGGTSLSELTSPATDDRLLALDKSDTTTDPHSTNGSSKWMSLDTLKTFIGAGGGGDATVLQPSGDTDGSTDAAAINAAVTALGGPGVIRLSPAAPWYIECGQVVINASGIYIDATGCTVNAVGSGDMIDMHDTSTFGSRTVHGGGILGFPVVDGTATTGNASAFHGGDIFQLALFFRAQNFTAGTTSKGAWLDNRHFWTEQAYGRIWAQNCTAHVVFDVSAGNTTNTGSFMRCDLDLYVDQGAAAQNGVVLQNGAFVQDGVLGVHGNFITSASTLTSAVLRLDGSTPGGAAESDVSNVSNSVLNIGAECDTTTGTHAPLTVNFATTDNFITNCTGNWDFGAAAAFTSSNNAGQVANFVGVIAGDANLPTSLAAATTNVADGNQTISATSATAITSLALPVAAFTAYKLELYLPHVSASGTGTYTIALGGAAINAASLDVTLYTGTTAAPTTRATNVATGALLSLATASTTAKALKVTGTIVFSAAGTLTVTGLKSSSGPNLTITAGAFLELTPMSAP